MKTSISLVAFALVCAASRPSHAQTTSVVDTVAVPADTAVMTPSATAPAIDQPVAVRRDNRPLSALPMAMAPANAGLGQAKAMMIVGGAALLTGAVVGGDAGKIIMVGGGVIGLYGLYQYLK